MKSLSITFRELADLYAIERSGPFSGSRSVTLIRTELPALLRDIVPGAEQYKIYGSAGPGVWAEVPWIAILDRAITTSTQRGYYVVYLFDTTFDHLYLSLSLGYLQFENKHTIEEARRLIKARTAQYLHVLTSTRDNFKPGAIDLGARNTLGKGYQLSPILSKRYEISALNDEQLRGDLTTLLSYYEVLKRSA